MLKELVLTLPGYDQLDLPPELPQGGLSGRGGDALRVGIELAFVIAIIAALFFIIWGGIQWVVSGGDKQKLASARSRIVYAIIGLIIILLSFFIVNIFTTFLGLPSPLSTKSLTDRQSLSNNRPAAGGPIDTTPKEPPNITRIYNQTQGRVVFQRTSAPSKINPVKEGDLLVISFTAPDTSGQFEYGIHNGTNNPPPGTCAQKSNECVLSYFVPSVESSTIQIDVKDTRTGLTTSSPPIPVDNEASKVSAKPPQISSIKKKGATNEFVYIEGSTNRGSLKKGDVIVISFTAPDISGQFEWGISGRPDKSSGACSPYEPTAVPNDCEVEYIVPSNAPITAKFYVLDLKTNKSNETPFIPIQ